MAEQNEHKTIMSLLETELEKERRSSRMSYIVSALLVLLVLGYTTWLGSQISTLLDPKGLALTASGLVLDSIPEVREDLKGVLVDGAPGIARSVTDEMLGALPSFRLYLEEQTGPVVDQVAEEMTLAAVTSLKSRLNQPGFADRAPAEMANAIIAEFEKNIEFALDEVGPDGATPQSRIDEALASLKQINHELALLEQGKNLSLSQEKERDLLMGWLEIIVSAEKGVPGHEVPMEN